MQMLSLGDTLSFSFSEDDHFTCSDPRVPLGSSNLVLKALALFRRQTGLHHPLSIHLEKNIPMEAGLGGGSSNAAATLRACNSLFAGPLSQPELQMLGAQLGSDVPFFFSKGTALCTGRGEVIEECEPLTHFQNFEIVKPEEGLSSGEVYQALNLAECSSLSPEELLLGLREGEPFFINDLQKPALRLCPALGRYLNAGTYMSGSGTACFTPGKGSLKTVNLTEY